MFDDLTRTYKIHRVGRRDSEERELTRAEAAAEVCIECGYHFPAAKNAAELLGAEVYGTYQEHGHNWPVIACTGHADADRLF